MELEAPNVPPDLSQDCGIPRRCKLFLGTELGRCAMVLEDPSVWPTIERRRELAAATCKLSLTSSESTTRNGLA